MSSETEKLMTNRNSSSFVKKVIFFVIILSPGVHFLNKTQKSSENQESAIDAKNSNSIENHSEMSDFQLQETPIDQETRKFRIFTQTQDQKSYIYLSNQDVVQYLKSPELSSVRNLLTQSIQNFDLAPGVFFESAPISSQNLHNLPFEFVLIGTKFFSTVKQETRVFQQHLTDNNSEKFGFQANLTRKFYNLGRDAMLVVPRNPNYPNLVGKENNYYSDLKSFLDSAEPAEIESFWITCGEALSERVDDSKVWFSTSGLGVFYLHMRLDSRPKYYNYEPYKSI